MSVAGDSLETIDLVLLGVLNGQWPEFESEVARGLALELAHREAVTEEEVRAEATRFRYEHRLISAAEFRQWLEERRLTTAEVSDVLRRLILRRRFDGLPGPQPDGERTLAVLRAEAFCDGIVSALSQRAIRLLAAAQLASETGDSSGEDPERAGQATSTALRLAALGPSRPGAEEIQQRISFLLSLERSAARLRREVGQPAAVADRIRDHALDWLQLLGARLTFEREGAAREARLLLRDGHTPEEVSERAGTPVLEHRLLVSDAPAGLRGFFASATASEALGPWEQDGRWHVMQVVRKVPPSPEDAATRERAIDELWTEAVERHAVGRTIRHVAL